MKNSFSIPFLHYWVSWFFFSAVMSLSTISGKTHLGNCTVFWFEAFVWFCFYNWKSYFGDFILGFLCCLGFILFLFVGSKLRLHDLVIYVLELSWNIWKWWTFVCKNCLVMDTKWEFWWEMMQHSLIIGTHGNSESELWLSQPINGRLIFVENLWGFLFHSFMKSYVSFCTHSYIQICLFAFKLLSD